MDSCPALRLYGLRAETLILIKQFELELHWSKTPPHAHACLFIINLACLC